MSRSLLVVLGWFVACCGSSELFGEAVTVFGLDGKKISGELLECGDSMLSVETASGPVSFAFETLDRLVIGSSPTAQPPRTAKVAEIVTLIDGSEIVCQDVGGRDDRWTAKSATGTPWEFPKGSVEAVLFRGPSVALKTEWMKALAEARTSDEMVVVRPGDAIDRASGMIVAIASETVEFSFDGQILQAPREKLLGLLWYRSREKRFVPAIQVRLNDGSRWEAASLTSMNAKSNALPVAPPFEAGLRWTTPGGVEAMAPWNEIAEINFSAGNVVWLASQSVLSKKTFQRSLLAETIPGRDEILGPRFYSTDGSAEAKSQDLHFVGPGEIEFRVPEGFKRFVAKIQRYEKASYATAVRCEVWVGDSLSWNTTLAPEQFEAVVDVPVIPDKRLRLVVACESDLALGTQLHWQQPRWTR